MQTPAHRCSRLLLVLLILVPPWSVAATTDLGAFILGVYDDEGAHPVCVSWAIRMFEWMGISVERIGAADVNRGLLGTLQVVYFPGGSSPPYIERITAAGKQRLREAVAQGMGFIGTCAGSMFAAETQVWEGVRYRTGQLGLFRGESVGPAPGICRGRQNCSTEISVASNHQIASGGTSTVPVMYYNSPFFRPDASTETEILATYATSGELAVVVQRYGAGWVLLTGPHPEWEGEETWAFMKDCLLWSLGLLTSGGGGS